MVWGKLTFFWGIWFFGFAKVCNKAYKKYVLCLDIQIYGLNIPIKTTKNGIPTTNNESIVNISHLVYENSLFWGIKLVFSLFYPNI